MTENLRARVFLSCGQSTPSERKAAGELARILRDEYGYEVYVATEQVSFEGVKEAIFPQLAEAEYFLFVDFPREKFQSGFCRGSPFSHQELAVAAFLETPYIGFRQKSVRREGLSQFLMSNVPEFGSEIELPSLLRSELARRSDWDPAWRKRLKIHRPDPGEGDDMVTTRFTNRGPTNLPVRFFHLTVTNLHRDKMALDCTAYVESIREAQTGAEIAFRPAEIKWAGTTLPTVPIPAGKSRDIDACRIWNDLPETIDFVSLSDSGKHMAPIAGQAIDVVYLVVSANFPLARCTLRIEPGKTAGEAQVVSLPSSPSATA